MSPQEVERMLVKARAQLLIIPKNAFFATLAMHLTLVESERAGVLATDGKNMYYNPNGQLAEYTMDQLKTGWAHESLHCGLGHTTQIGDKDPRLANIAMDYVINAILKQGDFELRPEWLYSPRFENMTWYEVYRILANEQQGSGKGPGQSPPGGLPGQGQPGQGQSQPGQGNGQPGQEPGGWGMVLPAPPPEPGEEPQEQKWRVAVQQAAQAARSCGKLPGGLDALVASLRGPRSSWFDYLKRFVADVMVSDYSWSHPSRRSASLGVYLPSTIKEGIGHIDLAIDTSGSISDQELECFGSKFLALHEELKPELTRVIYFDAKVQRVDEFGAEDSPNFHIAGRGGTDFRPIFDWIQASGREPKCLVVLTDLEAPAPTEPPSYPVLWISVNQKQPPWGDCAYMEV